MFLPSSGHMRQALEDEKLQIYVYDLYTLKYISQA